MTPLLKRLESLGVVERHRDAKDERVVRINLTPQGESLKEKAKDIPRCIAVAAGLNPDDLAEMVKTLDALRRRLSENRATSNPILTEPE